jgi:flagellar assembly protein FliH
MMVVMNSSKTSEFSNSELEALSIWQLPDAPGKTPFQGMTANRSPQHPSGQRLTVTEVEEMQKQAYDEAFAQGKTDGFEQGYNQGFEAGSQKGYQENKEALDKKSAEFTRLMEGLSEPYKAMDEAVDKELVKLSISLAGQIIRREIKMDAGQVIAAVREAITVLPLSSQKVTLYLHPEDAGLVRSVLSLDETSPTWTINEDPLITRGGCKIDTDVSHIDATVENRLAAVIATVFGDERNRDRESRS